jgi:hypothetical protein
MRSPELQNITGPGVVAGEAVVLVLEVILVAVTERHHRPARVVEHLIMVPAAAAVGPEAAVPVIRA